jgi:hypothetical protein
MCRPSDSTRRILGPNKPKYFELLDFLPFPAYMWDYTTQDFRVFEFEPILQNNQRFNDLAQTTHMLQRSAAKP